MERKTLNKRKRKQEKKSTSGFLHENLRDCNRGKIRYMYMESPRKLFCVFFSLFLSDPFICFFLCRLSLFFRRCQYCETFIWVSARWFFEYVVEGFFASELAMYIRMRVKFSYTWNLSEKVLLLKMFYLIYICLVCATKFPRIPLKDKIRRDNRAELSLIISKFSPRMRVFMRRNENANHANA